MAYAIVVRYHGPTDYRGSRWIATGPAPHLEGATCEHGPAPVIATDRPTRATVGHDYGDTNHGRRAAAEAVAAKLRVHGWRVTVAPGDGYALPDDSGYVYPLAYSAEG